METVVTGIGIISGVISLFFLVYKPLNAFSLSLQECALKMDSLSESFDDFKKEMDRKTAEQQDSLKELDKRNDKQDETISNHEVRIRIIEREVGIHGEGN